MYSNMEVGWREQHHLQDTSQEWVNSYVQDVFPFVCIKYNSRVEILVTIECGGK